MSDPVILAVQTALQSLGYSPGPLDGVIGPLTQAAVRAFQADHPPLAVDGDPGPETQTALVKAVTDAGLASTTPVVIPAVPGAPAATVIPMSSGASAGTSPAMVAAGVAGVGVVGWLAYRMLRKRKGRR